MYAVEDETFHHRSLAEFFAQISISHQLIDSRGEVA